MFVTQGGVEAGSPKVSGKLIYLVLNEAIRDSCMP